MIRDDLSDKLIHLTRGPTSDDAAQLFSTILAEDDCLAAPAVPKGGFRCVCFSEAPVSVSV